MPRMRDADCTAFLQEALPRLHLRWKGFRRVRRQVCKRIARRLTELGLPDLDAYRARLEELLAKGALGQAATTATLELDLAQLWADVGAWDRAEAAEELERIERALGPQQGHTATGRQHAGHVPYQWGQHVEAFRPGEPDPERILPEIRR